MDTEPNETGAPGQPGGEGPRTADDPWKEVGQQFHALGVSLAAAFRATVQSEESRRHLRNLQAGMEGMAAEIAAAVNEAAASPPARDIRVKAEKAATTARFATEDALQEARPQILSALRQVNAELERLIARAEGKRPSETEDTGK